jgi:CheY-like chemotaxis protein
MTFILSVGHASELLATRSVLLRSAGYGVREENDCHRALERAGNDEIDLVLLCYSLPSGEVQFLVKTLAEKRRMLPVLCVPKPIWLCSRETSRQPRHFESALGSSGNPVPPRTA